MGLRARSARLRQRARTAAFYVTARNAVRRRKGRPLAYLIGSPFHENLGDHAQSLVSREWIQSNYPGYDVAILDSRSASRDDYALIRRIAGDIQARDLVFLHSGYHVTDLYPIEIGLQLAVVEHIRDNDIVALPQTIHFKDPAALREVAGSFNGHGRVTLLCRDTSSYETAQREFSGCRLLLYPDIVTRRIGATPVPSAAERDGIQLCLRRDVESVYVAGGQVAELERRLSEIGPTTVTDTNSDLSPVHIRLRLNQVLNAEWRRFSQHRVTVTDRYHGVIFSLIAGTPVVALGTTDHKLSSGISWFPTDLFGQHIVFAENIDDAVARAAEFYRSDSFPTLPRHFEKNYFSRLKRELEGEHVA